MNSVSIMRAILLPTVISLALAGCGGDTNEMSQEQIQYISHVDQSRFFQRQGELRASTREARSAIELQPARPEPYLLILENLLTAGDARNAERQLKTFMESTSDESMTQSLKDKAMLILAEAHLMQGEFDEALSALEKHGANDRMERQEAVLLRGRILLASGQTEQAREAFEQANSITPSAEAQVGLSRVASLLDQTETVQNHIARAEEIDPDSVELWLWKARLAEQQQDWAAAEASYIEALEDIGRYDVMTFRKYETMSALIRSLREQGKSSEAFVYEEILAKSAPGTIRSNLNAAQSAYEDGNLEEAARYLEEIHAQAPGNEQAALMLGLVRFRQGRVEEAENLLAPVAELGESEMASKLVAASRLQLRDAEGAQRVLANLESADTDPSVLAMVGIASLSTGEVDAGEALLERSLSLAPDNDNLRARYTGYLLASDQVPEAFTQIEMLRERNGNTPLVRTLTIRAHLAANERQQAIAIADQWLKESPDNLNAAMTRGEIALQEGNFGAAASFFNRAASAHPENPAPLIALGRLALAQEKTAEAGKRFREAASLNPDNMQALQGMARTYTAEELRPAMETLMENNPTATAPNLILLEIALTNGDQARSDALAATLLERDSADRPTSAAPAVANIYNGVATKLRRSGENGQAEKVLERGRILFPENENLALQAASLAFAQNQTDKARRILQEIKQVHSDSPSPYLVEAAYFASQEQHQQAAELYELAISKGAGADAKLSLVRSMQRSGRVDQAIQVASDALQQHPDHQGLLVSTAMLHQQNDNRPEAMSTYEQLLETYPQNPLALNNLAWIYFEEGDDRASNLAQKAYDLSPDSAAIADTYGWILLKSGNQQASLPILEKAHELAPESEEIALHLAEAYREVGRNAEAKTILEKFSAAGNN